MSSPVKTNVKWIDGLRGLASISVVVTHLTHIADPDLFQAADSPGVPSRILQLPFIRVFFQGRLGVSIFGFVTGYVCVLKPTLLSNAGQYDAAYKVIAGSALRRIPRLVLPTAIATIILWLCTYLGLFYPARYVSSKWLKRFVPEAKGFPVIAVYALGENLVHTWTRSYNYYDFFNWTLLPLCRCAMHIFCFAFATVKFSPKHRLIAAFLAFAYFWAAYEPAVQMPAFFGVFMCQLQNYEPAENFFRRHPRACRYAAFLILFAALWIGSIPEGKLSITEWSDNLSLFVRPMLPGGSDIVRYSTAICLCGVTLSIHLSPAVRDVLANKYFLWLGKQSFAVYLLHSITLKTILVWMNFGFLIPPMVENDKGKMVSGVLEYKGHLHYLLSLLVYFPVTYGIAVLWMRHVDPFCGRLTKRMVDAIQQPM